ncbi:AbrB family transcriptional regulator [Bacillus aerolatus]|uniref:AbrB family transcriptional regulator n=1 Tax=Bacillus aerolatus TaxID=2653354 RepID=A0A6I1FPB5_9BACI|nr:AbrB family transcriptional regulator [Bacillus aerolatus]KAB7709167.1 AbrB family transcriptional regulator [Bacillus aerolatus]
MKENKWLFLILSSAGGFFLSLSGLSIGWILGTLLTAALISFAFPHFSGKKSIPKSWLYAGQFILGIELGQKINLSVLAIFQSHWMVIIVMLLLSIVLSLLSGFVLWKFSRSDMLTSFFGTAPGGISAMPAVAEEVGANTAVVSIIQTMRVFLVILIIPVIVSMWAVNPGDPMAVQSTAPAFEIGTAAWTIVLALVGWGGYYVGKQLKFPAPWLLGSMTAIAIVQSFSSSFAGHDMAAYWPHHFIVLSQILIAVSIGSRFHKKMFVGLKQTLIVAFISTLGLIAAMFASAYLVSKVTGLAFITTALAFAPGGIAEMATTSVVLGADSTFVVAVQVLRILAVCLILPPFFRLLHEWESRKKVHSHASA